MDLVGTRSYDEVVARVVARVKTLPAETWIEGRGWDQNAWGDKRFPTHDKLSAAVPGHPVVLTRVDGQATLVNMAAMRVAGLRAAPKDPGGGKVEHDAQRNPPGLFIDKAQAIVDRKVPAPTSARFRAALVDAVREIHRWGLTGVHDAGASRSARALKSGFQVNTHAIGDRGNRLVLDAYEAACKANPAVDHRFRVEHTQILHYDDIPRFAKLGVIPSMQASHPSSDMYWIGERLGPTRVLGAYAWRSLIKSGVVIPKGSDFPVELVNPLIAFSATIARQDANDWPAGGWLPEQRMTREEALRSMTLWPAYAAFQEKEMGSITSGKLADFVILGQDIMRVPAELVMRTRDDATYVGGKAMFHQGTSQ